MPAHDWTIVEDGIFHNFHLTWISRINDCLNQRILPEGYYSLVEQHAGESVPDVLTLHQRERQPQDLSSAPFPERAASTLLLDEAPPQVAIVTELESDIYIRKRRSLVIRHVSDDSVVALIEIVSPGNKSSRHAFEQFIDKVLELLDHGLHVMVVDLHPPTTRDPRGIHAAIAEALGSRVDGLSPDKPFTLVSYLAGSERKGFAQPIGVGDVLIPMPLFLSDDRYVTVPLEETYMSAFGSMPRHLQSVLQPPH